MSGLFHVRWRLLIVTLKIPGRQLSRAFNITRIACSEPPFIICPGHSEIRAHKSK